MDMRVDLHQSLVRYLKRTKSKKILFSDFCHKKHINKMSERATLKKVVMTSTVVGYTYVLNENVSEMLITLQ
ncbi:hypothetical protein [Vagococcus fluvialis]|uniref:Uncharacterized protein n=1 Tax=Vagococcus fluvialis TaxID=2738 RepID=A0A7X6D9W3_9ENTE|nr:hypothetical protein [Vagococcus fluvialis]NKC68474.1 hypothetical protein [Vagococcus fluvialis]